MRRKRLYQAGFFESSKRSVFLDGFDASSGDCYIDRLFQFRNVDFLFLEVGVATAHSGRVKLRRTSAV